MEEHVVVSDCVFCKIVKGEIPAKKVYEDENYVAFHDIDPQAPTHIIIIPKKHIESLEQLTEKEIELAGGLLLLAREIADKLKLKKGYRVVINTGPEGGQAVFHLHLHLLGGRNMGWPPG